MIDVNRLPDDWEELVDKFLQSTDRLDITGWESNHDNFVATEDLTALWKALISLQ